MEIRRPQELPQQQQHARPWQRREQQANKKIPTHFLAIRIVSESVIKSVVDLQQRLVQLDSNLQSHMIRSPKLHMTLCVMTLDSKERIEEAKQRLHSAAEVLQRHYPANGPRLDFSTLNHFRNRILYLEAAEDLERAKLKEFVKDMVAHFAGIATVENREWTPHVTVFKPRTNKVKLPDTISPLLQTRCGPHEFMHVDLLKMVGKGVNGYYPCVASVPFASYPPAAYVQLAQPLLLGSALGAAVAGGSSGEEDDAVDE